MATAWSRRRWRRGLWVPVLALVAMLASGIWLATQQSGAGYDGMMGDYGWSGEQAEPVESLDQARDRAADFAAVLQSGLEVGEVMQFDNHYYADLQESDGTKVTEVLIDTRSGAVRPEMGPATMWNTRFGMMGRSGGSNAEVTPEQAQQIADDWLADQDEALTSEDPAQFPGYYTLHTVRDGEITGMLSVHETTGDVWYHSWHDGFVEMSEHS